MHENKTSFFFKKKNKVYFWKFEIVFWRKIRYFDIEFVSYSVSLWPNIRQNCFKKIRDRPTNILKNGPWKIYLFLLL
jgi:hypothetical protein